MKAGLALMTATTSFALGAEHNSGSREKGQQPEVGDGHAITEAAKGSEDSKSCVVCSNKGRKLDKDCKCELVYGYMHSGCPLNRKELGRSTWALLHTMAAYYPENPSKIQQQEMEQFMRLAAKLYPCGYCADTTTQEISFNPPRTSSREELSTWLCEIHNEVNDRLGKPLFDCSKHRERWRDGPPNGMCG
eukprot:CAMPEP_0185261746 /NCGR_PEP_ID=MMETSP1359-20130426/10073_1 /TAXON_ID=552665 /ORGANISM="Bigelowiella longifila, Strain CCMP242" /LENGTH=189 /DNA_ID=CAMNT_0027848469 /DNA_START=125 /DNA_END=694 /DNA_ORIENTATION=+